MERARPDRLSTWVVLRVHSFHRVRIWIPRPEPRSSLGPACYRDRRCFDRARWQPHSVRVRRRAGPHTLHHGHRAVSARHGIDNPLGTAIALHPFGKQAGLASALLGFSFRWAARLSAPRLQAFCHFSRLLLCRHSDRGFSPCPSGLYPCRASPVPKRRSRLRADATPRRKISLRRRRKAARTNQSDLYEGNDVYCSTDVRFRAPVTRSRRSASGHKRAFRLAPMAVVQALAFPPGKQTSSCIESSLGANDPTSRRGGDTILRRQRKTGRRVFVTAIDHQGAVIGLVGARKGAKGPPPAECGLRRSLVFVAPGCRPARRDSKSCGRSRAAPTRTSRSPVLRLGARLSAAARDFGGTVPPFGGRAHRSRCSDASGLRKSGHRWLRSQP